jgi:outer membrane protein assembly factor BamE (lipoprotein component of BamABCDE complex)
LIRAVKSFSLCAVLAASVLVAGCGSDKYARGHAVDAEDLAMLRPGIHTRGDVLATLGSPSTKSFFGTESWYYIGATTEQYAYYAPEELDRKITALSFDARGQLQEIKEYTMKDGKVIQPNKETTPTVGHEISVIEQLLGNVGRFSKKD